MAKLKTKPNGTEPTGDAPDLCERAIFSEVEVRGIDEEKRSATFVAATENGVDTWAGKEHLRMSGLDLARYRKNPVVLDSHNRADIGAIVGRAEVTREGRTLSAEITFAETPRAEQAWQLVRGGFLRALSVGFIPNRASILELAEGQSDGTDENKVLGPARIIKKWELYEISLVPVPADAAALRRALTVNEELTPAELDALLRRAARLAARQEGDAMSDPAIVKPDAHGVTAPAASGEATPAAVTPAPEKREPAAPVAVAAPAEVVLRQRVLAITPHDLVAVAEGLLLGKDGKVGTFEEIRAALQAEFAKGKTPVGTPEPATPAAKKDAPAAPAKLADVSAADFARALRG